MSPNPSYEHNLAHDLLGVSFGAAATEVVAATLLLATAGVSETWTKSTQAFTACPVSVLTNSVASFVPPLNPFWACAKIIPYPISPNKTTPYSKMV
jgi:hypothetical protein